MSNAEKRRLRREWDKKQRLSLTAEKLRKELTYHPGTGIFTLNVDRRKKKAGDEIGITNRRKQGQKNTRYVQVYVCGGYHYAHRLAFLYMTDDWPRGQVDHIDGDGQNNAWSNLRDTSGFDNQRNIPLRKTNTTGIHGVRPLPNGKFHVTIGVNNRQKYLGAHTDFFEACCRRKSAENKYGFHKNHGRQA